MLNTAFLTYYVPLLLNWLPTDAVADAKKSLELNPNNAVALLRKGYVSHVALYE